MSKTDENLAGAFAGESQANRKYLAFAKKAEKEGHPQIAKLFRAAADAETVHAHAHLRVMGGIKGTAENLQAAVEGEGYEFKEMYPKFIEEAKADNNSQAVESFQNANSVEKIHHGLYEKYAGALKGGKGPETVDICVCQVCGNTVEGEAPDVCPVCGAPKKKFKKIE